MSGESLPAYRRYKAFWLHGQQRTLYFPDNIFRSVAYDKTRNARSGNCAHHHHVDFIVIQKPWYCFVRLAPPMVNCMPISYTRLLNKQIQCLAMLALGMN